MHNNSFRTKYGNDGLLNKKWAWLHSAKSKIGIE